MCSARRMALASLWAVAGACSSSSGPGDLLEDRDGGIGADAQVSRADAGARDALEPLDATGSLSIVAGTGRDRFEPLADGGKIELTVGPQGGGRMYGYHIWTGARMEGGSPAGVMIEVSILEGATRAMQSRERRLATLMPDGTGFVVYGMAPRLEDCCAIAEKAVIIRVAIQDREGRSGEDERSGMAGRCLDRDGVNVCL